MESLSRSLSSTGDTSVFELMYLDSNYLADFFLTLTLLRQIRSGIFGAIFLIPSASTLSRLRSSATKGQLQLRTRAFPLGVPGADPQVADQFRRANRILEAIAWCAEQALACSSTRVAVNLVFRKTSGDILLQAHRPFGHYESFNFLRAYLMFTVPLAIFAGSRARNTTARWVFSRRAKTLEHRFVFSNDRLVYQGPLPVDCGCGCTHPPHQATATSSHHRLTRSVFHFVSFAAHSRCILARH